MTSGRRGTAALCRFRGAGAAASFALDGRVNLLSSGLARGLCCGDFDGDGDGDVELATTESSLFTAPSVTIAVLRHTVSGLQPGDFTVARNPSPGSLALDCAHGDIDADAVAGFAPRPDFAVVNGGSADVVVHYGFAAATDTFAQHGSCSSHGMPVAVAVGDLNGDGTGDIVVANRGTSTVSVNLTAVRDKAGAFGTGSPGTDGKVPKRHFTGMLAIGTGARVGVLQARPFAPSIVLMGSAPANIDLGGGNRLVVADILLTSITFADAEGRAKFDIRVPNQPTLGGTRLVTQWVVFDPQGAFAGQLALSDGSSMIVGH